MKKYTLPISVVIITKNRQKSCARLLASLANSIYAVEQLVLVENVEDNQFFSGEKLDTTFPMLAKEFAYVALSKGTIADSRNEALRHTTQEIIVSLDDDVIVPNSFFSDVMKTVINHPKATFIVGNIKPYKKDIFSKYSALYFMRESGLQKKSHYLQSFSMVCVIMRKSKLKNGMIPFSNNHLTGEDVLFFFMNTAQGKKLVCDQQLHVYHDFFGEKNIIVTFVRRFFGYARDTVSLMKLYPAYFQELNDYYPRYRHESLWYPGFIYRVLREKYRYMQFEWGLSQELFLPWLLQQGTYFFVTLRFSFQQVVFRKKRW